MKVNGKQGLRKQTRKGSRSPSTTKLKVKGKQSKQHNFIPTNESIKKKVPSISQSGKNSGRSSIINGVQHPSSSDQTKPRHTRNQSSAKQPSPNNKSSRTFSEENSILMLPLPQTEKTETTDEAKGPYKQASAPVTRHRRTQSHRKEIQLPVELNQSQGGVTMTEVQMNEICSNFETGQTESVEPIKQVPTNVVRERRESLGVGLAAMNQSLKKYSVKNTSPPKQQYQVQQEDDQNPSVFTIPVHKPCDVVSAGNLNDRFNRLKEQRKITNQTQILKLNEQNQLIDDLQFKLNKDLSQLRSEKAVLLSQQQNSGLMQRCQHMNESSNSLKMRSQGSIQEIIGRGVSKASHVMKTKTVHVSQRRRDIPDSLSATGGEFNGSRRDIIGNHMVGDFLSPIPGENMTERWSRLPLNQQEDDLQQPSFIKSPKGRFEASGAQSPVTSRNNLLAPGQSGTIMIQQEQNIESEEDCDITPDEEENLEELLQQNAIQTKDWAQVQEQAVTTIELVEERVNNQMQLVSEIKKQMQENQSYLMEAQTDLDSEFNQAAANMSDFHSRYAEVTSAWESEIRSQNSISKKRASTILDLQGKVDELKLSRNEHQLELKKAQNEISMLNQAMHAFGVPTDQPDGSSLDNLRIILNENERLKSELKQLMDVTVKERQTLESTQRETIQNMPSLITRQYQNAMQELGSRLNLKDENHTEEIYSLRQDLDVARKRIVDLIKEKTNLENEMVSFQMKTREIKENFSIKEKSVKQLNIENQALQNKLEATENKLHQKNNKINELYSKHQLVQESLNKLKGECGVLNGVLTNFQKEKDQQDIDLENQGNQIAEQSSQITQIEKEKAELFTLIEMKSKLISSIQQKSYMSESQDNLRNKYSLDTIQRLSMFIVHQSRGTQANLSPETWAYIKQVFDDNTVTFLDRQDERISQLQIQSLNLLDELVKLYQDQTITSDLSLKNIELVQQFMEVFNKSMKSSIQIPQEIVLLHNKVYSRRFDIAHQKQKQEIDVEQFKRRIEKYEDQLRLLKEHGSQNHLTKMLKGEDDLESHEINQMPRELLESQLRVAQDNISESHRKTEEAKMKNVLTEQDNLALQDRQKKIKKRNKQLIQNREQLMEQNNLWFQKWAKLESMLRNGQNISQVLEFAVVVQKNAPKPADLLNASFSRASRQNSSNNRYEIRSAIEKKASGLSDAIRIRLGNQSDEEDDQNINMLLQSTSQDNIQMRKQPRDKKRGLGVVNQYSSPLLAHKTQGPIADFDDKSSIDVIEDQQEMSFSPIKPMKVQNGAIGNEDLLAMIECQAFALEEALAK